ncbi:MAG: GNAT family N-acetyltransferase [Anaerolineae bacterium]|nr:GNAT family N-acetyltransferase [Anaerolineae bacterium]
MHIRPYYPNDDPALMELERLSPRGLPEPFVHYRRRFIDRAAIFADHEMLVAENDGTVIGGVGLCVKHTHIGGQPVTLGYVFDVRTHPQMRRRGLGTALLEAVDAYLIERGVDGAYGHIVTSNVASLRLFEKLDYQRMRQVMLLTYQPYPTFDAPEWMPKHVEEYDADRDLVEAIHSSRDLYVPDVAEHVKDFGFQRWSLDMGGAQVAGMSLFDQSYVFQQWPADQPFPTEEEMQTRANKSLRLFDEIGTHSATLLQSIFDTLRDLAVNDNVSKLTLLIDRMDRIPVFLYSEAYKQMEYWMVFKSLVPGWIPAWQDAPIYMDAREL